MKFTTIKVVQAKKRKRKEKKKSKKKDRKIPEASLEVQAVREPLERRREVVIHHPSLEA